MSSAATSLRRGSFSSASTVACVTASTTLHTTKAAASSLLRRSSPLRAARKAATSTSTLASDTALALGQTPAPPHKIPSLVVVPVARMSKLTEEGVSAALSDEWPLARLETLLRLILEAGAYELVHRRRLA